MNWNININQKAITELNEISKIQLDFKDAAILDWMLKFHAEPKSKKLVIDERVYFWGSYALIIRENPMLFFKEKKHLSARIDKLINVGLLTKYLDKKEGNKTYFCITQKCFDLIKRGKNVLLPLMGLPSPSKGLRLLPPEGYNNNISNNPLGETI